jgi:nucleoside-diphosphate-sugar epimerase
VKVLVTGHNGYIGSVLVPFFRAAGHDVIGLDSFYFEDCTFGEDVAESVPALRKDVRDLEVADLAGFDAVIHLAALSNDPLGDINPDWTYDINWHSSVRLARLAKEAGVPRFLFSSSCSLYGVAGDEMLDETAPFNPITAYGESKIRTEQEVSELADDDFSPTFLRNATAYGVSPRLRADIMVNNLTGFAFTTGEVLIKSDGTPWRPLVHIEDISRAFLAVLEAPRDTVHDQAFNVGRSEENYQVRAVADMVREVVPGSRIEYASGGGPDPRNYRVNCDKLAQAVPAFRPRWTVRRGVEELYAAFGRHGLTLDEFVGHRYIRLKHIKGLLDSGRLGDDLRWRAAASSQAGG